MKSILFLCTLLSIGLLSCKKESNKEHCWILVDNVGNEYGQVCNKTEAQMISQYPNNCNYYKFEEQTYCWMLNGVFIKDASESKIALYSRCYGQGAGTKVDCSYCDRLYSREKRTYKPNSSTYYTSITAKTYCGNDLTSIPPNKQIIRKDDADSLIIIQFSKDGSTW